MDVSRWRRYGKDRLYVTGEDGTKVGWWDLVADEPHPEVPEHLPTLVSAVDAWRASEGSEPAAEDPADAPTAASPVPDLSALTPEIVDAILAEFEAPTPEQTSLPEASPAGDLATNVPGAMAREQAVAARAAAPFRSRLARVIGVHTDERAWRVGAVGEEKVAEQFEKVLKKDPRWRFLHSIPVGNRGSDIDHFAVGPGGVFTFNAKYHAGAKIWSRGDTLLVNGQAKPYVRNSRHEAQRAARLLTAACGFDVYVEGIIVPVRAESVVNKLPRPEGVGVVPRFQVSKWLRRQRDALDEETVEAIYAAARRPETWSGTVKG